LELSNSFDEVKNKAEANYEEVKTMVSNIVCMRLFYYISKTYYFI